MKRRTAQHGYTSYTKGRCRCERCKAAWAAYMREYKARTTKGYFADKQVPVRARLTPLAVKILHAAVVRNKAVGATPDDVIEATLRVAGANIKLAA